MTVLRRTLTHAQAAELVSRGLAVEIGDDQMGRPALTREQAIDQAVRLVKGDRKWTLIRDFAIAEHPWRGDSPPLFDLIKATFRRITQPSAPDAGWYPTWGPVYGAAPYAGAAAKSHRAENVA